MIKIHVYVVGKIWRYLFEEYEINPKLFSLGLITFSSTLFRLLNVVSKAPQRILQFEDLRRASIWCKNNKLFATKCVKEVYIFLCRVNDAITSVFNKTFC